MKNRASVIRKFCDRTLAGLIVCCLTLATAHSVLAQNTLAIKKKKLQQLQFEREQITKNLTDFKESEGELLIEIRGLSNQIRQIKARETSLQKQRKQKQKLGAEQKTELKSLQEKMAVLQKQAQRHVARIYRLTKLGDSTTLFTLARHKTFFKDAYQFARAARTDRAILQQLMDLHSRLSTQQTSLDSTLANLALLEKQLVIEAADFREKKKKLDADLRKVRRNRRLYRHYLKELEEVRRGMESAVVEMERRASGPAINKVENPQKLRGKIPLPATGDLVAGFGDQDPRYAMKKFQRGIVVSVQEGTSIKAVAPGRAVHAGPFRGYEQLVVLDHGQGLFTVYGHLEQLRLKKGVWVNKSTPLGHVAFKPESSTYQYYFEIRFKGKSEDPLEWLQPDKLKKKNN